MEPLLDTAGELPAHVSHWPASVRQKDPRCNTVSCDVTDVSQLRYYVCGLRCADHRPNSDVVVIARPEPTYVPAPIKQPTGRVRLPRARARRKK